MKTQILLRGRPAARIVDAQTQKADAVAALAAKLKAETNPRERGRLVSQLSKLRAGKV